MTITTSPAPSASGERVGVRGLLSLLLLTACGPVDLVVVAVPDAGAIPPQEGTPCSRNEDCVGGEFCETPSCSATLGHCVPRPLAADCNDDFRPECGCNGVSYWNGCVRRAAGERSLADRGSCQGSAQACDTTTACAAGDFCARFVAPNQCGLPAAGRCWGLPTSCVGGPDHFSACAAPAACLDRCAAIRSQQPVVGEPGPCP